MTASEFAREVLALVGPGKTYEPVEIKFELAYQSRLAVERIRFAIREIEKHVPGQSHLCEASLQLADALDRLESADRHFQDTLRNRSRAAVHDNQKGKCSENHLGPRLASQRPLK